MRMPSGNFVGYLVVAIMFSGFMALTWESNKIFLGLNHHRNRTELIQLHDQVAVSMSAADAAQVLERFRSSHLARAVSGHARRIRMAHFNAL
jgi:hypothetical protein